MYANLLTLLRMCCLAGPVLLLAACDGSIWNDPYPAADAGANILYSSFAERPKHLDPVQSYSSNEIVFTAQIYEPPLQYHYLKRPYTLIPGVAEAIPEPYFLDAKGRRLPAGAAARVAQLGIDVLPDNRQCRAVSPMSDVGAPRGAVVLQLDDAQGAVPRRHLQGRTDRIRALARHTVEQRRVHAPKIIRLPSTTHGECRQWIG